MKTQMKFQKILMIVSLIIAACSVLYALIFCGGTIWQISVAASSVQGAQDLIYNAQAFSDTFLILGIVYVLVIVLMMVMGNGSRRKYYITNYIATGIAVLYMLIFAVLLVVNVSNIISWFNLVDLEKAKARYIDFGWEKPTQFGLKWEEYPWVFTAGYIYFAIVIINAIIIALNTTWKVALMKGEKKLLEGNLVEKEVA